MSEYCKQGVNSDVEIPIYLIIFQVGLKKISRTDRLCNLCDDRVVGDELHYILKCKALCIERQMYIQEIYINKPSIAVMHKLFKRTLSPYFRNLPLLHITIRLHLTSRLLKFMQWLARKQYVLGS